MLDFDGNQSIDPEEFEYLVSCSVLIDKDKLFKAFDGNEDSELDIYEFVHCLLKESLRSKILSTQNVPQFQCQSLLECNVLRHKDYNIYCFVFLVLPVIGISVAKGFRHRGSEDVMDTFIFVFFIANCFEIVFRAVCYGPRRFWDLLKYPNPKFVAAAIQKYKMESIKQETETVVDSADTAFSSMRLTSQQRLWANRNLSPVRPLSILERTTSTLMNRAEVIVHFACLLAYYLLKIVFFANDHRADFSNEYMLTFLQIATLMRIFTLIPANRKLCCVVFSVAPQFSAVIGFLALFIYVWARIGCTAFGDDKKDIVIDEIYEAADGMVANFNSLPSAVLALIQLMIGEGWHEIMYTNTIATNAWGSMYFIVYILMVAIIIANIFVGLLLANIDELQQQQSHDEIIQHSIKSKSFEVYAHQKKESLRWCIQNNQRQNDLMRKQMVEIDDILKRQQAVR